MVIFDERQLMFPSIVRANPWEVAGMTGGNERSLYTSTGGCEMKNDGMNERTKERGETGKDKEREGEVASTARRKTRGGK